MTGPVSLKSFEILDPLSSQNEIAIEVIVTLKSGARRWCFFLTPTALTHCGDHIDGTRIPFHHSAAHMIVVGGVLTKQTIGAALATIDRESTDGLLGCTLPAGKDEMGSGS